MSVTAEESLSILLDQGGRPVLAVQRLKRIAMLGFLHAHDVWIRILLVDIKIR